MPKVSVIIPTHNRSAPLRAAISSVLKQTFQDFEIVVVDDASTDDTADVVRSIGDERIVYVRHDQNRGEGAARNTGIVKSRGVYVAFIDDDDEWFPEKLELQVALLDKSPDRVGVIYTGYAKVETATGRKLLELIPSKRGNIFNELVNENCIATTTVLARRECFDKVGLFPEGLAFGADYDLWLRMARDFYFDYVAQILANYYIHDNNVTRNYAAVIRGLEFQLARDRGELVGNTRVYSDRYRSLGVLYCYAGDTRKGRAALFEAVRLNPRGVRQYYNLFLCLLGNRCFRWIKSASDKAALRLRAIPSSLTNPLFRR